MKSGTRVFIKALIDSGNLFGDIMSERLANLLKIKYKPCTNKAGTAVANQKVHVLGLADPFDLILEGLEDPIKVQPYVIRSLSHDLNLGEHFLRRYKAGLKFEGNKATLNLNNHSLELVSRSKPLIRNSKDQRFISVMEEDKERRNAIFSIPDPNPNCIEVGDTAFSVETVKKTVLPKNTLTFVEVFTKMNAGIGFFKCKENNAFMNLNQLLPLNGMFKCEKNKFLIPILNMGDRDMILQPKRRLGNVYPSSKTCLKAETSQSTNQSINTLSHKSTLELSKEEIQERRSFLKEQLDVKNMIINQDQQEQVIDLFMKHFDAVSISSEDYGSSDLLQFHITLLPGSHPVRARCRPLNPLQEQDLKIQLDEWLAGDVIEPSVSPWASALVPCKKKGTSRLRWSIDFRPVNRCTVKDSYPLPCIESNLHKLSGAKIFSSLDSAGAFHSLSISPASRDYTTFISPFGTYRFKRMPFGLSNSPSAYCRLVQLALSKLPPGFAIAYLDDILIYSSTIAEHMRHLDAVLKVHADVGMKINLSKTKIFRDQVTYLGHSVSHHGIKMIPEYVNKIQLWPIPKTGKELISFLGFTSYYRAFIPKYAEVVAPLNKYRNEKSLELNQDEISRINKLKELFMVQPIRAYPDYSSKEPFILDTDFSGIAAGGILSQVQGGREKFIGCFSKSMDAAQRQYPAHKGELLAVILGLRKFEHILRARKFLIRTDSSAITFLQGLKEARGIFARWLVYLSSFDFDIMHRPGKVNTAADALSRTEMPQDEQDIEDPDKYLIYPEIDDVYLISKDQSINHTGHLRETCAVNTEPLSEFLVNKTINKNWTLETKKDYPLQLVLNLVKEGRMPTQDERKLLPTLTNSYLNWFNFLYVKDELLYIQRPNKNGKLGSPRICVPRSMQRELVKCAHAGHRGMTETLDKLRDRAFFPGMNNLVALIVNNCISCLQKNNSIPSAKNKIQHHEILSYPGQRVYLDTVGPLTPCRYKGIVCKHILTIQDGFTRYLIAAPIPDLETKTILNTLIDKFFLVHGIPETIHTDNGSSLMSHLFQDTCKQMGIKMTQTPTYSPQGNRVERAHRTLGQILRSDDSSDPSSWVQKVNAAVFEINVAKNRITGVAPYYAMYGRNPRVPLDIFFPENHMQGALKWTNFVLNLSKHFDDLHEEMMKHEQLCIPVSTEIKVPRGSTNISLGDIVYYMSPRGVVNLSKKLTLRWTGPYRVTGTPTASLSIINPIGNWAVNKRELHVLTSRLKRIDPNYSSLNKEQIDLDQINDEDDEDSEVQISRDRDLYTPDVQLKELTKEPLDSSEDEEEYFPQEIIRVPDSQGTPGNISPSPPSQNVPNESLILQPNQIKVEVDERLPQNRADDTEITVQTPVEKRKYNRRELPPPREGREGVRREAFSRAMKHFQQNLKKRNK